MLLHIRLWQHKNGFWYLMIPSEISSTGKWQQKSTKTKNKRVAERLRSQVQEYGLSALFGETNAHPLKEFLKNYSEYIGVSNSHGERTVELYDEIVPRVLKACSWPPTTQELLRYWKGRIDEKEIRPITANKERRAVHAALQWAVKGGLLSENPCSRVPQFELGPDQKEVKDDWYTDDELQSIQEWLPDRYRTLVLWAWATGMRLSECLNLRWEDLDTKVRVKGKGRKMRYLPMSRPMIQILQEIPQVEMGPFPFTRHQVSTAFYRARAQAKIKKGGISRTQGYLRPELPAGRRGHLQAQPDPGAFLCQSDRAVLCIPDSRGPESPDGCNAC